MISPLIADDILQTFLFPSGKFIVIQHDMQMLSHKCSGLKVTNAVVCFQNESRPKCAYPIAVLKCSF